MTGGAVKMGYRTGQWLHEQTPILFKKPFSAPTHGISHRAKVFHAVLQYGFFELGKFSAFYLKTFGEKPSHTLSRHYPDYRFVLVSAE
jgi:hypothetical protein